MHFCDGHYKFIAEDINYGVLRQLMTSNYQGSATYVAPTVGGPILYQNQPLDETW